MLNFKFQISNFKFLTCCYLLVVISLFFYSFTQVDLGLTLTRWYPLHAPQQFFQSIGYFNRPLSTIFYITILVFLYLCYFLFLYLAYKKQITLKEVWFVIIIISVVLTFSYNAFSYDLFNYIFDAKIITYYQQNPYEHKALDFPNDPMLSFMHWTHRVYPYGPVWLAITVPLSYIGGHFLLPTVVLFKMLMAGCFLGSVYFLSQILKRIHPEYLLFGTVFWGLQPLVIIESLVSAHNDIVMIFLFFLSLFLLIQARYISSSLFFLLSIGVKFITIFLFPIYIIYIYLQKKNKKISWELLGVIMIILMIIPVIIASVRTNFQPWYILYILSVAPFAAKKPFILIPSIIISCFALLSYVPYLYLGNWDPPVPMILNQLSFTGIALSVILVTLCYGFIYLSKKMLR